MDWLPGFICKCDVTLTAVAAFCHFPAIGDNAKTDRNSSNDEPIQAIPQQIEVDRPKVALGEKLFQDVRLSTKNQKSCLSCHSLSLGGTDRQ
jgi:cytochrome c peroxidase